MCVCLPACLLRCSSGWGPVAEALAALPGPAFDVLQGHDTHGAPLDRALRPQAAAHHQDAPGGPGGGGGAPQLAPSSSAAACVVEGGGGGLSGDVALVVFLGGVTAAEISALRMLAARSSQRLVVLTTQVGAARRCFESVTRHTNMPHRAMPCRATPRHWPGLSPCSPSLCYCGEGRD